MPAGVVAVIVVLLTTTTFVAAVPPNVTVAPAAKFVPVIVTAVPPAVDPLFGVTLRHCRRPNVGEPAGQASLQPIRDWSPLRLPRPRSLPVSSP